MKTQLGIEDRITLLSILPKTGNIITLKIIRSMEDSIGFSADELKRCEITQDGDLVHWNPSKVTLKEIEFDDAEAELIKSQLMTLNTEQRLTQNMVSIYDKFVG
jgi:hypothetical protein